VAESATEPVPVTIGALDSGVEDASAPHKSQKMVAPKPFAAKDTFVSV